MVVRSSCLITVAVHTFFPQEYRPQRVAKRSYGAAFTVFGQADDTGTDLSENMRMRIGEFLFLAAVPNR
jgi:hypothetical protein